jgi:hypothetical protein
VVLVVVVRRFHEVLVVVVAQVVQLDTLRVLASLIKVLMVEIELDLFQELCLAVVEVVLGLLL